MGTILSSPVQADPPKQLQINDLVEVLDLFSRHGYSGVSYYNLGLYLGLSPNTLDAIKENNRDDVLACLRECLKAWLKKADDVVKKSGPTIYSLVSALRELGENGVADRIDMEKHPACRILAHHTSNQSVVSALPHIVTLLHSEMLIKEAVCVKKEEDMLLIEIVKAVCIDSNKLEMFAKILHQYKATKEIGNTIMIEYRKVYYCDESKDDNAKQDEIYLPPSLTSKFKSMRVKLSFTFDKVELIIEAGPPSTLDKIKNALMYYSEDLKPQVAQCDNIHDILELVRKDCSLDDIEMLKAIVNELDIENAKVVVQEYSDAIEEFSKTELSKCLNERFSYASPLQCERITIVVDRNTDDCTLDEVRRLSANAFHKLSPKNSRRIKLNVIRDDNSFTITCSFPLILSEQLITVALNNIDALKENKVKRLTIGYCTVYEVNDTSTPTTTEIDEYTSSLSTSSGLMKQLMLSLSVQLINSTEEVTTLNEENMTMKKKAESLKETLNTKNKMLTASIAENERLGKKEKTMQLLQEKVSHLSEREEENKKLKEENKLLEEQLVLFQSEKENGKQSVAVTEELVETNKAKEQLHKEGTKHEQTVDMEVKETEKQLKASKEEIKQLEQSYVESKKEIKILQEKISRMSMTMKKEAESSKKESESLKKESESLKKESESLKKESESLKKESESLKKESESLKKESESLKKESESLKEILDTKNKMLSAYIAESDKFKEIAAEASQLLQEHVSHLTERDEENKELKEMKELLEEQLALFQSEKDAENKQLKLLQEKVKKMSLQIIEKDKQMQEMSKAKNSRDKGSQQDKILIFEDDTYGGSIIIDHPLIIKIVQTRQFQRLKDIKVLGYTYQIIPKAIYSRLQHSIGMYYLAGEYVKELQRRQPELDITESDVLCVQIAALCFNLGHGPFSHTFELFLEEFDRRWRNVSEASVEMFEYMLEDNKDLMTSFEDYNLVKDIAFIKELIQGVGYEQRKDKRFLYEIVVNKRSGLDVSIIDSTQRDAAVLGKSVTFKWRVFLSRVRVLRCPDNELHICFAKDDLETYNDFFRTRHSLYRELYYLRKSRIVALMIKRVLLKSNEMPLTRDKNRRVTLYEATKSMFAYTQLNDSILNTIKLLVDDPEVQALLNCLDSMKFIAQIGFFTSTYEWDKNKMKKHIVESIKSCSIADHLIFDPIKTGYENQDSRTQYYYTSDDKTGQWGYEWALPPPYANKSPLRIFLVSGDRELIHEVQQVVKKLVSDELEGAIYPDQENVDLMPSLQTS